LKRFVSYTQKSLEVTQTVNKFNKFAFFKVYQLCLNAKRSIEEEEEEKFICRKQR